MKGVAKIFLSYFPVLLVSGQVLVDLLYFLAPSVYFNSGFYLNLFFGTNIWVAVFFLVFTFTFKFCRVSRWAAIAECLFALNYLIVRGDNLYNILFQVIVGLVAIFLTTRNYIKKFPLCQLSLFIMFFKKVFETRSCSKGIEQWDEEVKRLILDRHEKSIGHKL